MVKPHVEFETQRSLLVAFERPTLLISLLKATGHAATMNQQRKADTPQEIAQTFFKSFLIVSWI